MYGLYSTASLRSRKWLSFILSSAVQIARSFELDGSTEGIRDGEAKKSSTLVIER